MAWAAIVPLLVNAPTAEAHSSGGCNITPYTLCTTVIIKLDTQVPTNGSVVIHAVRHTQTGMIDDKFDLTQFDGFTFGSNDALNGSHGPIFGTNTASCGPGGIGGVDAGIYDFTIQNSNGITGAIKNANICGGGTITLNMSVNNPAHPSQDGSLKFIAKANGAACGTANRDINLHSTATITELNASPPFSLDVNLGADGSYSGTDKLLPGTYTIHIDCFVGTGGQNNAFDVAQVNNKDIVVKAGAVTDLGVLDFKDYQNASGSANAQVDCDAGTGFTWIICGTIHLLVSVVEDIQAYIIVPTLQEPPLDKNQPEWASAYKLWSAFRQLASIFFILVFFFIIIGTAAGFDNYTIKKVLPHLVAAAILMPFSWYICALIMDIGNVLGHGIVTLVSSVLNPPPEIDLTTSMSKVFFGAAGVGALFLLYGAGATIGLGVIVTMVIAFAGVFLTLIFRRILILICIIISPFALLAWVLPGTQKFARQFWRTFTVLVMMYPGTMGLFEAGRIFSAAAGSIPSGSIILHMSAIGPLGHVFSAAANGLANGSYVRPLFQIAGLTLPLFGIPFLFKYMGKAFNAGSAGIGRLGGMIDKKYGKDSAAAQEAAANRELNNLQRGRTLSAIGSDKNKSAVVRLGARTARRVVRRRAGHTLPISEKGPFRNVEKAYKEDSAYSTVMAKQSVVDANNRNKQQEITPETNRSRRKAEMIATQQKKIEDRAKRMGLVQDADAIGEDGERLANQAIFAAGLDASMRAAATKT